MDNNILLEKIEELTAYICDDLCRHPREAKDQEELDSICVECPLGGYRHYLLNSSESKKLDGEDMRVTEIKKGVVRFIVNYYKENRFYPSYDEIAKGICRAKSTVHAHMKKLEEEGVIIRKANCSLQYRIINIEFILAHEKCDQSKCSE